MIQPPVTSHRSWRRAVALCAIVIAAYSNAFRGGFTFDSRQLVVQDARVHAVTADNLADILQHTYWWPYGESGLYRPITTLSYLVNYAMPGGERPFLYHAVNLVLHVANVLLVWVLALRVGAYPESRGPSHLHPPSVPTFRRRDAAFMAAAIWAVLPVSVEAVTNIAGRADLLAALGVLAGLLVYRTSSVALAAATLVAIFSKESGIVIAPLVVAYELVMWEKSSRRRLILAAIAMALPIVVMYAARRAVLGSAPPAEFAFVDNPIVGASWIVARLTAVKTTGLYLWKLAWPVTLSADYSYNAIPLASGSATDWLAWTTVGAVAAAIVVAARRDRAIAFFGAFAAIAFLPASNLLFATGTIFGERLLYLPSVGLVAIAALALARLPRAAFAAATATIVVALAARTWTRNADWTSDVTLWRSAVAAEPASAKIHHALADALYAGDPAHTQLDEIVAEQERAVAIVDRVPDAFNSFAIFRQAGAYHLDRATALKADGGPEYEQARSRLERAKAIYEAGATRYGAPNASSEADIERLLASAYLGVHDAPHAIAAATRARDLDPLAPLPYRQIATAHLASEEPDRAAVTLMVGSIVTADRGLTQALLGLYAAGLDERDCATSAGPSGPALNTTCDVVQRHLCAAAPEAARLDRQLGRFTEAERVESTARTITGCRGDR